MWSVTSRVDERIRAIKITKRFENIGYEGKLTSS